MTPSRAHAASLRKPEAERFTKRQGQFLAFLHSYRVLHRRSPSEREAQLYFRLTPPSVHSMIVRLEELGLLTRTPGEARSVCIAIAPEEIPTLEPIPGPAW